MTTQNTFWNDIVDSLIDTNAHSLLLIFFSCLGIYIVIIIYTRVFGKRSFSKMSSFDFAMTVAIGSIIATTVLNESVSIVEGAIGLFFVYLFQLSAAILRRFKWFTHLIDNRPTLLMDGAVMLKENMKSVRVTEGDLRSKIREANVSKMSDIKAVIFETTGDMVILHNKKDDSVDEWIMKDVQR